MANDPPRPKQPSRPDGAVTELDRTPWGTANQRRADDPRRQTSPGGVMAVRLPGSPTLPLEHSPTVPARALQAPTQRATPAGGLVAQTPDAASLEALRRRAEAAEDRAAELERRARVRDESDSPGAAFPPPVSRHPSPVPSSTPAKVDQAIGWSVRHLLAKAAPLLLAAAGIGGGATAVLKPSADPAKTDAVLASQEATRADVALLREQVAGMLKREAARDQYVRCLEESLDEVGEQLLPAQDRLTNASPLRAYVKRCSRLRP